MRWIQTTNGAKAHVVFRRADRTLCGINVSKADRIMAAPDSGRCEACDLEWRKKGRRARARKHPITSADSYEPKFTIKDWEGL